MDWYVFFNNFKVSLEKNFLIDPNLSSACFIHPIF